MRSCHAGKVTVLSTNRLVFFQYARQDSNLQPSVPKKTKKRLKIAIFPGVLSLLTDSPALHYYRNIATFPGVLRTTLFEVCSGPEAKITDEGNQKKAKAAREQHAKSNPRRGEKMVADHNDPRPSNGKHVARETRAAEAKVSPATMSNSSGASRRSRSHV